MHFLLLGGVTMVQYILYIKKTKV